MTIKNVCLSLLLLTLAQQSFAPNWRALFCCLGGAQRGLRRAQERMLRERQVSFEALLESFLQGFTDEMFAEGLTAATGYTSRNFEDGAASESKVPEASLDGITVTMPNQALFEKVMSDIMRILVHHKITNDAIAEYAETHGNPAADSAEETAVLTELQEAVFPELRKTLQEYVNKISSDRAEAHVNAIIAVLNCIAAPFTNATNHSPLTAAELAFYQRAVDAITLPDARNAAGEVYTPRIAAQIHAFFSLTLAQANAFFNTSNRSLISRTGSVTGSVIHRPGGSVV